LALKGKKVQITQLGVRAEHLKKDLEALILNAKDTITKFELETTIFFIIESRFFPNEPFTINKKFQLNVGNITTELSVGVLSTRAKLLKDKINRRINNESVITSLELENVIIQLVTSLLQEIDIQKNTLDAVNSNRKSSDIKNTKEIKNSIVKNDKNRLSQNLIRRGNTNDENFRFFITNKEFILQINKLPISKLTIGKSVDISLYDDESGHLIEKTNNVPIDTRGNINYEIILTDIHTRLRFVVANLGKEVYDSEQSLYREYFIFDEDGLEILDDSKPSGRFSILVDALVGVRMDTVGKYMPKKKMFKSFKLYEFNGKQVKGITIKKRELFTGSSKIDEQFAPLEIKQSAEKISIVVEPMMVEDNKKAVIAEKTKENPPKEVLDDFDFEKEILALARL